MQLVHSAAPAVPRDRLLRLPDAASAPRLAALTQLLRPMRLLPFDGECAAHAARIRADLEAAGTPAGMEGSADAASAHSAEKLRKEIAEAGGIAG